ncbi:MAG: O-antigen ligase family protein [Acidobacteriota bacterium]
MSEPVTISKPAQKRRVGKRATQVRRGFTDRMIFWCLVLAVVIAPLLIGSSGITSLMVMKYFAVAILCLWAIKILLVQELNLSLSVPALALIGYCLLVAIQLLPLPGVVPIVTPSAEVLRIIPSLKVTQSISLDPVATEQALAKLVTLVFLFIVAHNFITRRNHVLFGQIILWLGFAIAIFGLVQHFTWTGKIYWFYTATDVAFGPFTNRDRFAGYTEMTMALALAAAFSPENVGGKRALYSFVAIVMGVAIVVCGSRGGIVAMVCEFTLITILALWYRSSETMGEKFGLPNWVLPVAGVALLVCAIGIGASYLGMDRTLAGFETLFKNDLDVATGDRIKVWKGSWQLFWTRPLLGSGLGAFGVAYTHFAQENGSYWFREVHNDYLQVLTDTGLVGALLGVIFLLGLVQAARRKLANLEQESYMLVLGAIVGIVAILIHSLVDFNLQIAAHSLLFLMLANFLVIESSNAKQ